MTKKANHYNLKLLLQNTAMLSKGFLRALFGTYFFSLIPVLLAISCKTLAQVPELEGYRLDEYDAPVPEQLTGATTIDAIEVKQLQQELDALVIDVIPAHRKPEFLPENQIWIPPAHKGIAGALWLPDIGYGVLSETTIDYFKTHLQEHTRSRLEHPVIFYCRVDCWMSWNAAKRALELGYTDVYWFPGGIDYWEFEGFELENLQAAPGKRQ